MMARQVELLGPPARLLIKLLEGPKFTRELLRDSMNPSGIGGPESVRNARNLLLKLGLVKTHSGDETPRPRYYTELTGLGIDVAHHLKAIEEILKEET